jgi:DNA-binding winged helix-turn-helix (wHTH) protein
MSRLQDVKVGGRVRDDLAAGGPAVIVTDVPPDGLVEVVPVPETGQVMVITAHLLPEAEAGTPASAATALDRPEPGWSRPTVEPDGLVVHRDARRVWSDGGEVTLTFREFELLDYLTARPGKVFSRGHLMNAVWADPVAEVGPRTVDVHIHRLRRKLGRHGKRLVTVRQVGYVYRPPEERRSIAGGSGAGNDGAGS